MGAPDSNGIGLPEGFSSRVVARGLAPVVGTAYVWHVFSDGQATYPTDDGGWILVSNCEAPAQTGGGASALRFGPNGQIVDAYRILGDTQNNCAGGPTPWGTWLSCEEHDTGRVWECDPAGQQPAVVRPAMGVFSHEATCVDPDGKRLYLTEDEGDSGFYRFTPESYPDLSSGLLEVAVVRAGGAVDWVAVPDPSAGSGPVRKQVSGMTKFERGEGIWFDAGVVYVSTTRDSRVHAYDTVTETIEVLYDGAATEGPLRDPDNMTVSRSGDLFVCEDADDLNICLISPEREVTPFVTLDGSQHAGSELAGAVFDPSGTRLYFSSQRAFAFGAIYEVSGPFRQERPAERFPPRMLVEAPDRISAGALAGTGLPVTVRVARPVKLTLALRTARLARRRRRRSRAQALQRTRQPLLGRVRRDAGLGGRLEFRVRPGARGRRRFRNLRPKKVELAVTAVDRFGNRRRIVEEIRVTRRRRRRAKKR